jgi:hypothetical protein
MIMNVCSKEHNTIKGFNVCSKEQNTIKGFSASIHLKENVQPVFRKARPVPYALQSKVEENLTNAVNQGILVPVSTSKWASPIAIVPKSDKSVRICGDYKRTVNN